MEPPTGNVNQSECKKRKRQHDGKGPAKKKSTTQNGNYSGYYGYRDPEKDMRVEVMKSEWFKDKKVLDIGCNSGLVTLKIFTKFSPVLTIGTDLDEKLIRSANTILSKRRKKSLSNAKRRARREELQNQKSAQDSTQPTTESCTTTTEALARAKCENSLFTREIQFITADILTDHECYHRKYDTILCLSVTKWIHLNNGDEGIMKFFKKCYEMLEPDGKFILEPQQWKSYRKKCGTWEKTKANFSKIQIKPPTFPNVLKEIGFVAHEELKLPQIDQEKAGFNRPIYVFYKSAPLVEALAPPSDPVEVSPGTETTVTESPIDLIPVQNSG